MSLFLTRPRRIAVALFAFSGAVAGANLAVPDAKADEPCMRAKIWIYHSQQGEPGRENKWNDCIAPAPWEPNTHVTFAVERDEPVPAGMPSGAGFHVEVVP